MILGAGATTTCGPTSRNDASTPPTVDTVPPSSAPSPAATDGNSKAPRDPAPEGAQLLGDAPAPSTRGESQDEDPPDYSSLPPPPSTPNEVNTDALQWATAVMVALNTFHPREPPEGELRFHITMCKDGRFTVASAGGTLEADAEQAVLDAVGRADIPPPPPEIMRKMKNDCAQIRYTFTWTPKGVR